MPSSGRALEKRKSAETREAVNLKIGAAEGQLAQVAREREQTLREVRVAESELGELGEMVTSLEAERGNVELEVTSISARAIGGNIGGLLLVISPVVGSSSTGIMPQDT